MTATDVSTRPIKVFYSYARKDAALRDELATFFVPFERSGIIESWHDQSIEGGDKWRKAIHEQIDAADVILLLLSPDFLASEFCMTEELARAQGRERDGKVEIIPVLMRACSPDEEGTPLAGVHYLSHRGKALGAYSQPERDTAFDEVSNQIKQRILKIKASRAQSDGAAVSEPQAMSEPEVSSTLGMVITPSVAITPSTPIRPPPLPPTPGRGRHRRVIVAAASLLGVTLLILLVVLLTWPWITIVEPANGSRVPGEVTARGTGRNIPAGQTVWGVVQIGGQYWPQRPVTRVGGDWTCLVGFGGGAKELDGRQFELLVVTADADTNKAWLDWIAEGERTGNYPGLNGLPDGVMTYDKVTVTLKVS
jgi:hypothetical protein